MEDKEFLYNMEEIRSGKDAYGEITKDLDEEGNLWIVFTKLDSHGYDYIPIAKLQGDEAVEWVVNNLKDTIILENGINSVGEGIELKRANMLEQIKEKGLRIDSRARDLFTNIHKVNTQIQKKSLPVIPVLEKKKAISERLDGFFDTARKDGRETNSQVIQRAQKVNRILQKGKKFISPEEQRECEDFYNSIILYLGTGWALKDNEALKICYDDIQRGIERTEEGTIKRILTTAEDKENARNELLKVAHQKLTGDIELIYGKEEKKEKPKPFLITFAQIKEYEEAAKKKIPSNPVRKTRQRIRSRNMRSCFIGCIHTKFTINFSKRY